MKRELKKQEVVVVRETPHRAGSLQKQINNVTKGKKVVHLAIALNEFNAIVLMVVESR